MTRSDKMLPNELSGRHVLFGLIGFFAVIFAVNGVFLYKALSTYTGVVSNEPYRAGLHYNERIAAEEQQTKLGWKVELADVDRSGTVRVVVETASGEPVRGLEGVAHLGRPSTAEMDRTLKLREASPGVYAAQADRLDAGAWLLDAKLERGASDIYRLRRRLWLKP